MLRPRIVRLISLICCLLTIAGGYAQSSRHSVAARSAEELGMVVKVELSGTQVFVNQPVLCTVKLYNPGYNIVKVETLGNADYGNCDMRASVLPRDAHYVGNEVIDGKRYQVAVLSQMVLFPQESGSFKIKCPDYVIGVVTSTTPDPFFGFYGRQQRENFSVTTGDVKIKVKDLPKKGRPADFSGAVGNFELKLTVPPGKITRGSDCICIYTVTGPGSLEDAIFPDPTPVFPEELAVKTVNSDDQVYISQDQVIAEGSYEVTFVPAKTGHYTVPAMKFCYFNPKTGKYEYASSEAVEIEVHSLSSKPSEGPVLVSL